jgi:lysophospholipase L1-like esterase
MLAFFLGALSLFVHSPKYVAAQTVPASFDSAAPVVPAGATFYFVGDSITFGLGTNDQVDHGCAYYTYPSPCFADRVSSYFGAQEVNLGAKSSCLEKTTTPGSECSAYPWVKRYVWELLPHAGVRNNWFWIQIGTNDVGCIFACEDAKTGDRGISVDLFKAGYEKIVSALENAGTPGNQIVLSEIPWFNNNSYPLGNPAYANPMLVPFEAVRFNAAVADVAIKYHTRFSSTYRALASCEIHQATLVNPCTYDGVHPNNLGHAKIADEDERANFTNAFSAKGAYEALSVLNSGILVTNPFHGTFSTDTLADINRTPSSFGSKGRYTNMNMWAGSIYNNFGTGPSNVYGVQGNCWEVYPSTGGPAGGVDFTVNCASGDGGFEGNVHAGGFVNGSDTVVAHPWHPPSDPTCTIAPGGTSGCSVKVTMPASGMRCSANMETTNFYNGIRLSIFITYSGAIETLGAETNGAAVPGGASPVFSEVCT